MTAISFGGDADEVVLRVRGDAMFVPTDDGVWLRNDAGSMSMAGAGARAAVEWLFETIGDGCLARDLYRQVSAAQQAGMRRVVGALRLNGFLSALDADDVASSLDLAKGYPEQIELLAHYTDRPGQALRGALATKIACVGSGLLVRSLLIALSDLGFSQVQLVVPPTERHWVDTLWAHLSFAGDSADWSVEVVGAEDLVGRAVALADHNEIVLSTGAATEIPDVEAGVRHAGAASGWLTVLGGRLVSSPLLFAQPCCSTCVHHWIGPGAAPRAGDVPIRPLAAAMASFHLVHRVLLHTTGIKAEDDRRFTSVDLEVPLVESHLARAHPRCGSHGTRRQHPLAGTQPVRCHPRPDIATPLDGQQERDEQDRIVGACAAWVDPFVGPLRWLGEGDLPQLPLALSACELLVAPGTSNGSRNTVGRFVCAAVAAREARNQAVLIALASAARDVYDEIGAPCGPLVIGSGWTQEEAIFRASLQVVRPGARCRPGRTVDPPWPDGSTLCFLWSTLEDLVGSATLTSVPLVDGFWWATVTVRGREVACASGLGEEHALGNALLAAVADNCGLDASHPAPTASVLAPPTASWLDAAGNAPWLHQFVDLDSLIEFVAPAAHLIGLVVPLEDS